MEQQVEVFAYAMVQASTHASVVLTWPAESDPGDGWTRGTMWNDTAVAGGGYPTPFYVVATQFNNKSSDRNG